MDCHRVISSWILLGFRFKDKDPLARNDRKASYAASGSCRTQ